MSIRIAHVTDIHWQTRPALVDMGLKRALGSANLYLMGRRHHFTAAVQSALVEHIVGLEPDAVVVSGDLTAQALRSEFDLARAGLQPVLDRFPTLVIPGNHDAYTHDAVREGRFEQAFGPWMHKAGAIARLDVGPVTVLGLDPNAPRWVNAHGVVPQAQLDGLAAALAEPQLADRVVVLTLHYPVVDRHGAIYDGKRHGLLNARALLAVLSAAPVRPVMVLHGHIHHGYRSVLPLRGAEVATFDPGSSGYAYLPAIRRAAGMNLYAVLPDGSFTVQRYLYDGRLFSPEPGGPYATGR